MQYIKKNILIADDDPMTHRLVKGFLSNLGYHVTSVMNGNDALAELNKGRYNILISDIEMPGIDGIQLTVIIRNSENLRNLPIILLTASSNIHTKLEAFNASADDYVTKPFFFDELAARIKTQLRIKSLQEEIEQKNLILMNRNSELEINLEIARQIQTKLLPLDAKEINNVKISTFYKPSDKVGGDLFDVIPHKDGKVSIFIGDVAGHGVPAAFLNIILKMLLHSITKKEEAISPARVLEEINTEIMDYIHNDEFITAFYGIIDTNNNKLIYASAGNPPGLILHEKDREAEFVETKGFCLGFTRDFKIIERVVDLFPGDRLFLFTDGLMEIKNHDEELLGLDGLHEIIIKSGEKNNIQHMVSYIVEEAKVYNKGREYEDDITLLCFEMPDISHFTWSTGQIDIQHSVQTMTEPLTSRNLLPAEEIKKIKTALQEALYNAVDHGNLEIPDFVRGYSCDDTIYKKFKEKRLTNPKYAEKNIYAQYLIQDNKVSYIIKDEGRGFDHTKVKDPALPENITRCSGRGLALLKMIMDEVSFNNKGNEIRLVKYFIS